MGVGITVGNITDEIGSSSFLHAFFSTISVHCEPEGWGTRFPFLMNHLYQGKLPHVHAKQALRELRDVHKLLVQLPPTEVVWDYENRSVKPPWGDNIADTITNLGNYFVSSTGRDIFDLMNEALEASANEESDAVIR